MPPLADPRQTRMSAPPSLNASTRRPETDKNVCPTVTECLHSPTRDRQECLPHPHLMPPLADPMADKNVCPTRNTATNRSYTPPGLQQPCAALTTLLRVCRGRWKRHC